MSNNAKLRLGRTLGESGSHGVLFMTDCESYGMVGGCDEDCPVLNEGKCDNYSSVDEFLLEQESKVK